MNNWQKLFQEHLLAEYRRSANGNGTTNEPLLTYLLQHNLVPAITIRRYVILREFERRYQQNGHHKTKTVLQTATDLQVSENTVWTVLKDHRFDFE